VKGRVLIVAGTDPSGGAGIQADIKAITALDSFAATAVTALTAQNTLGVFGVVAVAPDFVRDQIRVVAEDIGADCVKTGMLANAAVIEAAFDEIGKRLPGVPIVVDPVMVAKGGASLLESDAVLTLIRRALPMAALVTPNAPEAERLAGIPVHSLADMEKAGQRIFALGPKAVLVKGGHVAGGIVRDLLLTPDSARIFEAPRIATAHTHGTGCTLASAIAAGIARGMALEDAVARAHAYLQEAIRTAPGLGGGAGPVGHSHTVRPFMTEESGPEAPLHDPGGVVGAGAQRVGDDP
jgi:hydroxymethylpyrimidine/phosphomethylpyrimidine kinase